MHQWCFVGFGNNSNTWRTLHWPFHDQVLFYGVHFKAYRFLNCPSSRGLWSSKVHISYPVQICDPNHTPLLMNFQQSLQWPAVQTKKSFTARKGGHKTVFLAKRNCLPSAFKACLQLKPNPDMTMLFSPFRWTHRLPLVPPFLFTQTPFCLHFCSHRPHSAFISIFPSPLELHA